MSLFLVVEVFFSELVTYLKESTNLNKADKNTLKCIAPSSDKDIFSSFFN